jgi:hypothetical protein
MHTGSATHNNNLEQRFQQLPSLKYGNILVITDPVNPTYTIPGYYLLFVFNTQGVLSQAKIIRIMR